VGAAPYRFGFKFNGSGYHHGFTFAEVLCVAKINDLIEVVELLDGVVLVVNNRWKRFQSAINDLKARRKILACTSALFEVSHPSSGRNT
jgi:hypothetical protein